MFGPLRNPTYLRLFAAQVVALLGTGLLTVALALLAYDLAGEEAGAVLGTALAIKMLAYVGVAPLAGALAARLPRRALLVALDLARAGVAVFLPFVSEIWHIYALIFLLQSASAAFTPTFQATIPDILPDERDYTRALSLSRLAYDLESLASPALAALLLTLMSYHDLFAGTVAGFILSAGLVLSTRLPAPGAAGPAPFGKRVSAGLRVFLATPRLRALLAVNLGVAAAGAMVIVNTVVLARAALGGGEAEVAVAMAAFGAGSMAAALALPPALDRAGDRRVVLPALGALAALLLGFAALVAAAERTGGAAGWLWPALLAVWAALGFFYSAAQLPAGRLLRRSASPADRPALFAAQFALSHAAWLLTYPLAGGLGAAAGMPAALIVLGLLAALAALAAARLWPREDPETLAHDHVDLPAGHPHLGPAGARRHAHPFVIDDLHPNWPSGRA